MSVKEIKAYPETGWGMPFVYFFDSSVAVDNRAKNGRSTKSFLSENLWQPVAKDLKEGDYVFIQFGHNDESKEKKERYTTPEEYKANLLRFINETKSKEAIPVLLTPVSRRKFNSRGKIQETHEIYSDVVRSLAKETNVAFIDMDKKTQQLLQKFGKENSRLLFLQLQPGEHPHYPLGIDDNTHFNELGARLIAQIVLKEIRELNLDLAKRLAPPRK
jgi:lysophospholipase L1-like esterase